MSVAPGKLLLSHKENSFTNSATYAGVFSFRGGKFPFISPAFVGNAFLSKFHERITRNLPNLISAVQSTFPTPIADAESDRNAQREECVRPREQLTVYTFPQSQSCSLILSQERSSPLSRPGDFRENQPTPSPFSPPPGPKEKRIDDPEASSV